MGPLITAEHRDRVAAYLDAGPAEGATLVVDGRIHPHAGEAGGYFLGPSVLDFVTPHMEVYRDEIFGPVLCVVRVPTTESAIALVNANPYGNGTAVFTADGGAARRFEEEIEVGMVGVNVPIPVPAALYPFGGWKDSLFGDLHIYGEDGVRFYTRNKVVTSRWPDPSQRGVDLGFPRSH
jgi:malonate-semialdehyde dehydrogenase (acetylating) / methylmalonate-semialdehyde dehydrogenase